LEIMILAQDYRNLRATVVAGQRSGCPLAGHGNLIMPQRDRSYLPRAALLREEQSLVQHFMPPLAEGMASSVLADLEATRAGFYI